MRHSPVTPAPIPGLGAVPAAMACARVRILRAAARLYATRGYEGTSVREVAEAAGVTKPLVHYHFGSKEQLFASLLRESMDSCRTRFTDAVNRGATAHERLRALLAAQFERAREAPEIVAFVHEVMSMPGLLPLGFDYKAEGCELFELYVRVIEDGQRSGEFRAVDARAVVVMAIATVGMYVAATLACDLEAIPANAEDVVFDLLTRGLGGAA